MDNQIFNITNVFACLALRFAARYKELQPHGEQAAADITIFDFANCITMIGSINGDSKRIFTYYFIDDSRCTYENGLFKIHSPGLSN